MLMGAFFGGLRRRQDRLVGPRAAHRHARAARRWRPSTRSSRSRLRADQIVTGTALNFIALGLTGYLYVDIYGDQGTPDDLPRGARRQAAHRQPGLHRAGARTSRTCSCGAACWRSSSSGWSCSARRAACGCARSARTRKAAETVGIDVLRTRYLAVIASGAPGRARRGVPVDRLRPLLLAEHDRGARVHRAGRADLRPLAAGRRCSAPRCCSASRSALAQRLPEFSPSAATLFQALPYVLTLIAVAGIVGRSTPAGGRRRALPARGLSPARALGWRGDA